MVCYTSLQAHNGCLALFRPKEAASLNGITQEFSDLSLKEYKLHRVSHPKGKMTPVRFMYFLSHEAVA